ncbi:DUF2157 domain-containing protein [Anatilimnocola floriformis]|uniref:DUF2157 domain-containing protein n=1 Tax=Anatilimnocola floriformis TaxID=2948575 RepID=UPI0020C4BD7D|nr:DUF2157 domain-containing protein [Anatilimnocola floriformis]
MPERRPLSVEIRAWLQKELALWQQQDLLSGDQVRAILAQYESEQTARQNSQNVFLYSLGGLAALLMAAAVLLLVSFNWQEIPPAGKLAVIFGSLILTYATGAFAWQIGFPRVAEVVFFFAALLYGAAIWLIAQIFHMSAHYPDGYFWWAVGVLPLAIILDTLPLHVLFAFLLGTWFSTEIIGFRHLGAVIFGWRIPAAPNIVLLAPIMAAPGIWLAYRGKSFARLGIYLSLIVFWISLQPVAWRWEETSAFFIAAVGSMLLILGESHPPRSPLSIPYRVLGVILYGGALLPLSFTWFNDWYKSSHVLLMTLVIAASTGLVLAAAEFVRFRLLEQGKKDQADLVVDIRQRQWFPLALAGVIMVLALLPAVTGDVGIVLALLVANAAMIGLAIWLMWVGLRDDRGQPFVAGIVYFMIWMFARYADLFGIVGGMLGAAALFATCGLLIGGFAWFWHRRKQVLHG